MVGKTAGQAGKKKLEVEQEEGPKQSKLGKQASLSRRRRRSKKMFAVYEEEILWRKTFQREYTIIYIYSYKMDNLIKNTEGNRKRYDDSIWMSKIEEKEYI